MSPATLRSQTAPGCISKKGAAVATLAVVSVLVPQGWQLALEVLSEAYLAVSVFVAGTLALHSAVPALLLAYAWSGLVEGAA